VAAAGERRALPIEVDLSSQHLTIEGLAVGVIRNADWM
jgi:repressor LexA